MLHCCVSVFSKEAEGTSSVYVEKYFLKDGVDEVMCLFSSTVIQYVHFHYLKI